VQQNVGLIWSLFDLHAPPHFTQESHARNCPNQIGKGGVRQEQRAFQRSARARNCNHNCRCWLLLFFLLFSLMWLMFLFSRSWHISIGALSHDVLVQQTCSATPISSTPTENTTALLMLSSPGSAATNYRAPSANHKNPCFRVLEIIAHFKNKCSYSAIIPTFSFQKWRMAPCQYQRRPPSIQ